jgi:3-oxoacyl-[acyl-carrier protein] reductase
MNLKTAVITGASRGIGRSIAEEFAREGYNVALIGRDQAMLDEVVRGIREECPVAAASYRCDIRNKSELVETFSKIFHDSGSIDVLVNNAGMNSRKSIDCREDMIDALDENLAGFCDEIATNLTGSYVASYVASSYMIRSGGGSIINISSIKGIEPTTSLGYGASKAGLVKMTKDFAKALAARNIRVNCIAPGFIDAGLTQELPRDRQDAYKRMIPQGKFGEPKDIACACAFLASEKAKYITGVTLCISGGYLMQ